MTIGRRSDFVAVVLMAIRQSALQRLKKNSISAKDIAKQSWCEKQMELYILSPMQTYAMEKGAAFHETKKEEVFVPLSVEPVTYADRFYKTAYENYTSLSSLRENGVCREVKLYGSINGYKLVGQLDELRMQDGKVMVVEDKTVSASANFPTAMLGSDTIQVSLYKRMLEEIRSKNYTFDNFANSYSLEKMVMSPQFLDGLSNIGVKKELQEIRNIYRLVFEEIVKLPEVSELLEIRYFNRANKEKISEVKINYDKQAIDNWVQYAMKYWAGERDAAPVPESEKWKCKMCRFFGKECTVWWNK